MSLSGFLDTLRERGFIEQTTDEAALEKLFSDGGESVSAYIGFDPSSSSLHVGSLVPIMALVHLQRCGHRPIALVGGGTGRVGDPSGKTELRKMLGEDSVDENLLGISNQLSRYLELSEAGSEADSEADSQNAGFAVDNAEWLLGLNYVDFLRDIGRHFSVNRMLSAESVKLRIDSESGLSFLEFNYSILQAYDFLVLNQRYGCQVQMGGSDQWGNIVNGMELGRRMDGSELFGLTTPLLTTADGGKMGKTASGAVWLNEAQLPNYDFWQYWRNVDDRDVGRFLRLFTDLDLAEIARLEALEGAQINEAKTVLANEVTTLVRGAEAARLAERTAAETFAGGGAGSDLPTLAVGADGMRIGAVLTELGFTASNGEAKRKLAEGAVKLDGAVITEPGHLVTVAQGSECKLSLGKKKHAIIRAQ